MTITITIATDNEAFQDGNKAAEVSRIIAAWAQKTAVEARTIGAHTFNGLQPLRDVNGNTVGSVKVSGK